MGRKKKETEIAPEEEKPPYNVEICVGGTTICATDIGSYSLHDSKNHDYEFDYNDEQLRKYDIYREYAIKREDLMSWDEKLAYIFIILSTCYENDKIENKDYYDFIDMVEEIYDKIISEKEKEGIVVDENITPRQVFTYIAAKGKCRFAGTNQRWVQTGSYIYGTPCIKNIDEIMKDNNLKTLLEHLQEKIFVRNLIFNNISYIKLV